MKHLLSCLLAITGLCATAQDLALANTRNLASTPFQEGLATLRAERFEDAMAAMTKELAAHPNNGKAWYYRGVVQRSLGQYQSALQDLDRAHALMPNDPHTLLRRSEVLSDLGRYDEAKEDLDRVLEGATATPVLVHALLSLGQVCLAQDDLPAARQAYDRLIMQVPGDARAWCGRGVAKSQQGEHDAAITDLSQAILLDPALVKAYPARAIAYVHTDQRPEACADLLKARALGDDSVAEMVLIYCE
jgi:tetratricopeptide (TPR) repeat protein